MQATRLDRLIMAVSPAWGSRRVMRRRQHALQEQAATIAAKRLETRLEAAFDAADHDRLRGHKWMTSRLSPNDVLDREWETLVLRCEQEYRNNSVATSAVDGRVDNVVGCGIRFQARVRSQEPGDRRQGGESDAATINRQFEERMRRWAKVVRLNAQQRKFERSRAKYGEGILVMSDRATSPGEIPLWIEVIHPRRLETPPEFSGDANVRLGIRFDENGLPETYYFRRQHPDDSRGDLKYDAVPAARVCHSFEDREIGQARGYPWLAPVLSDLKDCKDFAEAHLISEQVSACTTAWVKTGNPYQQAIGAQVATASTGERIEELYPGAVEYIGSNDEVQFNDPNRPGGTFAPYMEWRFRQIAAGLRYPFELLCKMFTNNFSGGRLALIDGRITFRCWQGQSIEECWERVGARFMEECVIFGLVEVDPSAFLQERETWTRHAWVPPGWQWIDPLNDVQSDVVAVDNNLGTVTESLAGRGKDLEEATEERTRERLLQLEADAMVERRRLQLAEELGNPAFGLDPAMNPGAASGNGDGTSDNGSGDRNVAKEKPAQPRGAARKAVAA